MRLDEGPSDRTADVTESELARFLFDYTGKIEAVDIARALLDAYGMWRQ
jgi:hypothetical protein